VELLSLVAALSAALAARLPLQGRRCDKITATLEDYGF